MCQSYPGFRCSPQIAKKVAVTEARYAADPTPQNSSALSLVRHEYMLTSEGQRALYATGDFAEVLKAMDERSDRLAASQRFNRWRRGVSRQEAEQTSRRLEKFSPFNLEGVAPEWMGEQCYRPAFTSRQLEMAFNLAVKAHEGVKRRSGDAYINHPLRVHKTLTERYGRLISEETRMVALLHDAVEDSDLTFNDLRLLGFSERVIAGVESVTKRAGETYPDAVARAALNRDGLWVKMLDINDNCSASQLAVFDEIKRLKKKKKYYPALRFLREVVSVTVSEANVA